MHDARIGSKSKRLYVMDSENGQIRYCEIREQIFTHNDQLKVYLRTGPYVEKNDDKTSAEVFGHLAIPKARFKNILDEVYYFICNTLYIFLNHEEIGAIQQNNFKKPIALSQNPFEAGFLEHIYHPRA